MKSIPQFKHNDIIWAKVTGHPWWPGMITEDPTPHSIHLYRVDFFGYPPSHSLLPANKIIRYEDYHKLGEGEQSGRAGPSLKRAISQASILYHTLEQSKNSPIGRALTQSCLFEAENAATEVCKSEVKGMEERAIGRELEFVNSFDEPEINQQEISNDNKRGNDNQNGIRSASGYSNCKRIRKNGVKPLKHLKTISIKYRKKQDIQKTQQLKQQLEQLLHKYKLDFIPQISKKTKTQQKQGKNIVKLLYRMFRKQYNCNRGESMDFALNFTDKINSKQELVNILAQAKQKIGIRGLLNSDK